MKHILANWKMQLGVRASVAMARSVLREMRGKEINPHIIVFPSFTALSEVRKILAHTKVHMGAQAVASERGGAFTGQISTAMLEDVGATHAIVGHPEYLESHDFDRVLATYGHVITTAIQPIVYLGCSIKREEDMKIGSLSSELSAIVDVYLGHVPHQRARAKMMIVVEPEYVRLGHEPADPLVVAELFGEMRDYLRSRSVADAQCVLFYGGHIDAESAHDFLREPLIDGVAVGSASIKLQNFADIMEQARDCINHQSI